MKTFTMMSKIRSDWAEMSMARRSASAKRKRIGKKKRGKLQLRVIVMISMMSKKTNCSKRIPIITTMLLELLLMRQQQYPLLLTK